MVSETIECTDVFEGYPTRCDAKNVRASDVMVSRELELFIDEMMDCYDYIQDGVTSKEAI